MTIETLESVLPYLPIIWVACAAILAVIEAFSLGLTTIWFAIGAVCAAIVSAFDGPLWLQVMIFFVVSVITLIFTRPIAIKKLKVGHEKNNIELMIDEKGLVVEDVAAFSVGKVKCKGLEWSAVGIAPEESIPKNTEVKVIRIEGVKLIVEPLREVRDCN